MPLTEYIAIDIDENHVLSWKHDSGGTKDLGRGFIIKLASLTCHVLGSQAES
jgi:hypothetical protein